MASNFNEFNPPIGTYMHTLEWVKEMEAQGINRNNIYKEFFNNEDHLLTAGKTIEKMKHDFFSSWKYQTGSSFVSVLPNGRVVGSDAAIISPDNRLLWDISQDNLSHPTQHPIFQKQTLPPVQYIAGNIGVLTYRHCDNYFHWMYDVVPRIQLLRKSGIKIEKYIVKPITTDYQIDTLNTLGIPRDQLIELHHDTHIKAENLIVTSWIGSGANYPKWATTFLRQEFLKNINIDLENDHKRLYISRENAGTRRILNEDEVYPILNNYGFKKIYLENYTVLEKVKLFASAEVIIGPHGAGLATLAFCKPGTKVIEIFPPTYISPYFFIISNYANLDYHYLIGEGELGIEGNGTVNIVVNPHDVLKLLDLTGI